MTEFDLLNQLPLHIFWKDLDLNYLGCNELFLQETGMDCVKGKSDFDMPWQKFADKYRTDDIHVMQKQTSISITEMHVEINGQFSIATVSKKPLYTQAGQLIGMIGVYHKTPVTDSSIFSIPFRQKQILRFLVEGLTARETAATLGLSIRTVESYVNTLKAKLGCKNKAELIKKAIVDKLLQY